MKGLSPISSKQEKGDSPYAIAARGTRCGCDTP
jgi:hypothetical protein